MNRTEAENRGWDFTDMEIAAQKNGHVFKGDPADVFARIARFEEHGDFQRAVSEASRAARQHEDIDKLVQRVESLRGAYTEASAAYRDLSEQAEDSYDFDTFEGDFAEHERIHLATKCRG